MDIRWSQRFENFTKAIELLNEISFLDITKISMLEKEGIIQRFEYTLELAWKTLKDKMISDGLELDLISPKMVLKEAYKAKYLENIEIWIEMINSRNLLSHIYDFETFERLVPEIKFKYISVINDLHNFLQKSL